jgi:hypothetical protein
MTATVPEITLPPFEADKGAPLEPPPAPPVEPDLPPRRQRRAKKAPPATETPAATAEVQTPPISDEDKKALAGLLTTGFGVCFEIVASRRGDHWRLTKDEAGRLGAAWSEPLAPLLAENSKYVPWAIALLATAGVLTPRLQADSSKLENAENAGTATQTA